MILLLLLGLGLAVGSLLLFNFCFVCALTHTGSCACLRVGYCESRFEDLL